MSYYGYSIFIFYAVLGPVRRDLPIAPFRQTMRKNFSSVLGCKQGRFQDFFWGGGIRDYPTQIFWAPLCYKIGKNEIGK